MKKKLIISLSFIALFVVFTLCVLFVDRQPGGETNTEVGFYTINNYFHQLTGVSEHLYKVTDYFEWIAIFMGMGFGVVGLIQWIKRKNILKVDYELSILGIFYITVLIIFALFLLIVVNYRPVYIDGDKLESSYPSSTTFLALTFMLSAFVPIKKYTKNRKLRITFYILDVVYMLVLVVGRICSGVHWFTDILGAVILGVGIVFLYFFFVDYVGKRIEDSKQKKAIKE